MGDTEKDLKDAKATPALGSRLVQAMFKASAMPGADRKQLRAGAQGMLDAGPDPVDEAWLHLIVARSYRKNDEQALASYERAYELAKERGLGVALLNAGMPLNNLYRRLGRNQDATRVLTEMRDEYGDRVLDGVDLALDKVASTTGRAISALGRQLTSLGNNILGETRQGSDADGNE